MADERTVAAGRVISIHYTLRERDEVIDSSGGEEPMEYLHGAENIVPGLEEQLTGRSVGETVHVRVEPAKGYGVRDPDAVQQVPREAFPPDAEIEVGMQFLAEGPEGERVPVWIVAHGHEEVTVDANHPLAGKTLDFEVSITGVREATAEELAHRHPHSGGCGH